MARDTEVIVPISADKRPLEQTLKDTTNSIERESRKWDRAIDESSQNMQRSMTRALDINRLKDWGIQAAKAMVDFGLQCVDAASALEEVQNVVDVTFGDSASSINAWAKTAIAQFGLSETKAKQFASTMGAVMKSSGLAGNEIVSMSENLAGLAADMASFYNLDFDTAFQKIRSGISGETEPLKQLGINMSQANLEAFALQQGITKSLDKMSQGETVMLRYQYLMQATADAQGDFARTSDGYANATRLLQSNLESIQASLGQMFIPILAGATTALNDFLKGMVQSKPRTVLDDFADINLKTDEKLKEIEKTAEQAEILLGTLGRISAPNTDLTGFISGLSGSIEGLDSAMKKAKEGNVNGALSDLADALSKELGGTPDKWQTLLSAVSEKLPGATTAVMNDQEKTKAFLEAAAAAADDLGGDYSTLWGNFLKAVGDNAGAVVTALANAGTTGQRLEALAKGANTLKNNSGTWRAVLGTLKQVNGLENIFSADAGKGVEDLATALSGEGPDADKAAAWKTFMDALGENADAFSNLTGKSPEETKKWLEEISSAANTIEPGDADAWNKLISSFVGGFDGAQGEEFIQQMAAQLLAMGSQSETARDGLLALGYSSDEIADKQAEWLETCKRLVQTIPGLSEIVNIQTGEVKGGADAVHKYIDEWQQGQEKLLYWKAYYAKRDAQIEQESQLRILEIEAGAAQIAYERARKQHPEFATAGGQALAKGEFGQEGRDYLKVWQNATEAQKRLTAAREAMAGVEQQLADEKQYLIDKYGEEGQAAREATAAAVELSDEQKKQAKTAISEVEKAVKALKDYTDQAYSSSLKSIEGTLGGFNKVLTPAQQAQEKIDSLNKTIEQWKKEKKDTSGLENELKVIKTNANEALVSVDSLSKALDSQIKFMSDYYNNLSKLRQMGFSDDVIAMLSDGSTQSAGYAAELVKATDSDIQTINNQIDTINKQKETLAAELTENKLKVDDTYDGLVTKADEAVKALDKYGEAKDSTTKTMNGIVDALNEATPTVRNQVDGILAMLAELAGGPVSVNLPSVNTGTSGSGGSTQPLQVNTALNIDGRQVAESVSTYQMEELNQMNRSGGNAQ